MMTGKLRSWFRSQKGGIWILAIRDIGLKT